MNSSEDVIRSSFLYFFILSECIFLPQEYNLMFSNSLSGKKNSNNKNCEVWWFSISRSSFPQTHFHEATILSSVLVTLSVWQSSWHSSHVSGVRTLVRDRTFSCLGVSGVCLWTEWPDGINNDWEMVIWALATVVLLTVSGFSIMWLRLHTLKNLFVCVFIICLLLY